ncbi:prostaglandin E2 receptor EP3 subtype isoform X1 [Dromiciops gliroides]|uniref:prostaglandin E2 receptor EP3 subtype isoform X1 n=1 Tax=Dromiciops gliroides TaxID=33562 RepID=UPI001CC75EA7|nr:prostaglandin E2 receptor EP3 subtype isoform X1 [Dromiciops gliroides]
MKEPAGGTGAPGAPPFCRRLNHSYPGTWGAEPVAPPGANGTGSLGADACGSVSVAYSLTMMITGIVGNALAMLLVSRSYRRRESKRKKSFLLCIGGLALTDLVGQLLTSPVVVAVYLSQRPWQELDPKGHLCSYFGLSMTMFGLCPLFIASAMAVERTLAIRAPHWYASHMKTRATRAVLLAVWLLGFAFALLPVAGVGHYTLQWPGTWCFISTGERGVNGTRSAHSRGNLFFASTFAFLGLTALAVTFVCNLATIKALVSRCRAKATAAQVGAQWGRITTETVIQLMGIMCVLSACWSPLLIMMLKMIFNKTSVEFCNIPNLQRPKECDFFLTAVRLASLNQILDPWVYLLLRKILLRKFCQLPAQPSPPSSWEVIPEEKETALSTSHTQDKTASLAGTARPSEGDMGGRQTPITTLTTISSKMLMEAAQDPEPENLGNGQAPSPVPSATILGSAPMGMQPGDHSCRGYSQI